MPTRLLQAADLVYQGTFTLPDVKDTAGNYGFEYAQGVLAFNPANHSLFVVGHDWDQQVAEVSVPAFNAQAAVLQPFTDVLEGRIAQINPTDPNSKKIGSLAVFGNQLVVDAYSYYDGNGSAVASHFVRSTMLNSTALTGPFRVGSLNPAFYAGYMSPIPSIWQTALGGSYLDGACCLGVVSRTSYGPSVSALNEADLLAARNPTPATMLVGYPDAHQTLSGWSSTGPLFNGTTVMRGVLLVDNTATVLFFGRQGLGTFCYGPGTTDKTQAGKPADGGVDTYCYDPDDGSKGTHAYPYEPHVWAYNANDLAAVKAGSKQPWDIKPYATWRLPTQITQAGIGGVAFDAATGRLFVSEQYGDGAKLRIHVLAISGAGGSTGTDTLAPTASLTSPTAGATVSGTTSLSATASDNVGVASVWFTVDGTTIGAEDTSAPYTGRFDTTAVANGSHTIRVAARDAAGNTATSAPISVTVNNSGSTSGKNDQTPPTVTLTAPTAGATVKSTVTLSANASDNVGVTSVQFLIDGAAVGAADTSSPYRYTWSSTTATNGTHQVQAVARDAAGNVTTSAAVTIAVANSSQGGTDTAAPTVSWKSPVSGTTVSGRVALTAAASDNVAVTQVTYGVDGQTIGTSTNKSGYPFAWSTAGSSNGTHHLSVTARDAAGNTAASTIAVTVRNTNRFGR